MIRWHEKENYNTVTTNMKSKKREIDRKKNNEEGNGVKKKKEKKRNSFYKDMSGRIKTDNQKNQCSMTQNDSVSFSQASDYIMQKNQSQQT